MSSEPLEDYIPDEELTQLLQSWTAPGPSGFLDKRIASSYARELSGAEGLSQPMQFPQRREEVVSMKFCSKCSEEFADKFSFCPVDGTPLVAVPVKEEPSVTVIKEESAPPPSLSLSGVADETPVATSKPSYAAAASASALTVREEYHLTIMDDAGLVQRLSKEVTDVAHEYELTWPEFKRDPFGFTKRTFVGYGQMLRKFLANRNVLMGMGAAVLAMGALVVVVAVLDRSHSASSGRFGLIAFAVIAAALLVALFSTMLGKERGAAVMGAEVG